MTLRLANISGILGGTARLRIAKVSGTTTYASGARLRLAKVSGNTLRSSSATLRLAKISGSVASGTTPVLGTIATQTVDPVFPATIVASVTNGVAPDSYGFSAPGVTFSVSGNVATFSPPGSLTGGTLTVTVTATKGVNTATTTATVIINPAALFYSKSGVVTPQSYPYVK